MRRTRADWVKIVEEWRGSGRAPEEFSEGRGFAPSTLQWWASRLRSDNQGRSIVGDEDHSGPALARVRVVPERPIADADSDADDGHQAPTWELRTERGVLRGYGQRRDGMLREIVTALLGERD